jgi:hypothetical protein
MNVIGMEVSETGRKNSVTDDIIKEENEDTSIPDDEARGGNITINFAAEPVVEVNELGMMDIERRHPPTFVSVTHEVDGVQKVESFPNHWNW